MAHSSIISSGKKRHVLNSFFLSLQASELLDSLARGGILLAPDKQAILIVVL